MERTNASDTDTDGKYTLTTKVIEDVNGTVLMKAKLTEEQKSIIIKEWNSRPDNPPALLELIRLAFPNENVDGRSKEGRAVKEFLGTRDIRARGAHEYQTKDEI